MQGTCDKEQCALWGLTGGHCPNYVESWWQPGEKGAQPVLVADCAPRRTFLMIQDLHQRLVGVQKAQEEQRNAFDRTGNAMARLVMRLRPLPANVLEVQALTADGQEEEGA